MRTLRLLSLCGMAAFGLLALTGLAIHDDMLTLLSLVWFMPCLGMTVLLQTVEGDRQE